MSEKFMILENGKLFPYYPKTNPKYKKILYIFLGVMIALILVPMIVSFNAEKVEHHDLPLVPDLNVEMTIIVIISMSLIYAYLRDPNKYKNCPYKKTMIFLYFPIIFGIIFFVRYSVLIGILLINIPEIEGNWNAPLIVYYDGEGNIILTIVAYYQMIFFIIGEITTGLAIFVLVDIYKGMNKVCRTWSLSKNSEKRLWINGDYQVPMVCKPYEEGKKLCKLDTIWDKK